MTGWKSLILVLLALAIVALSFDAVRVSAGTGIAALYPGDTGIENHPDVIFVERFEQATMADLFTRWSDVKNGAAMSLSSDVPPAARRTLADHPVDRRRREQGRASLSTDHSRGGRHALRPLLHQIPDERRVRSLGHLDGRVETRHALAEPAGRQQARRQRSVHRRGRTEHLQPLRPLQLLDDDAPVGGWQLLGQPAPATIPACGRGRASGCASSRW